MPVSLAKAAQRAYIEVIERGHQNMTATAQIIAFPAAAITRTPAQIAAEAALHAAELEVQVIEAAASVARTERELAAVEAALAATQTFEVGAEYSARSVVDADFRYRFMVERRTAKTVWLRNLRTDELKQCRVSKGYRNEEVVYPNGKYSMCLCLGAGNKV
jgi:Tfp pilus assembly protein PilX